MIINFNRFVAYKPMSDQVLADNEPVVFITNILEIIFLQACQQTFIKGTLFSQKLCGKG